VTIYSLDGIEAAERMMDFSSRAVGRSLWDIYEAYEIQSFLRPTGRPIRVDASTALTEFRNCENVVLGDAHPPAGVPVWFDNRYRRAVGWCGISLGSGYFVAVSDGGIVERMRIEEQELLRAVRYLGWSTDVFGFDIDFDYISL
jgi:hypothetical protein